MASPIPTMDYARALNRGAVYRRTLFLFHLAYPSLLALHANQRRFDAAFLSVYGNQPRQLGDPDETSFVAAMLLRLADLVE